MSIRRYVNGQAITAGRLNELTSAAVQHVAGTGGVGVTRSGNTMQINLSRRHRGVPPVALAGGSGSAFHDAEGPQIDTSGFTFDGTYQALDLSAYCPGAIAIQLCVYPNSSPMEFRNHYLMPGSQYPAVANDGHYNNLLVPATDGVIDYRGLASMSSVDLRVIGYWV